MLQAIHEAGFKLFDDRFEVIVARDPSPASVIPTLKAVRGIIVRVAGCPKEIIDAAPDLKVIAKHGVGPCNIDVAAATEREDSRPQHAGCQRRLGRRAHGHGDRRPGQAGDPHG
jgi:D-3-phosphoglycerate dehydrogenase